TFYRDIYGSMGRTVNWFGKWISPYGLLIRLAQVFLAPLMAFYAAVIFHKLLEALMISPTPKWQKVYEGWRRQLTDDRISIMPSVIYGITFLLWPFVFVGAVAAVVNNVRKKRPWRALFCATDEHPAIRYRLPEPVGNFFLPRPIEVSPIPIPPVEPVVPSPTNRSPTTQVG
ncbi:hypothetical protein PMAYCL1PPCAC_28321, partial [Pristionchus mayeri]